MARHSGSGEGATATASTTALTPVSPDTSTNVQGGYDFLSRFEGELALVSDRAGLVFHFGAPVAGEFVIDRGFRRNGNIALLAGEYLTFLDSGSTNYSEVNVGRDALTGDVVGGLLRGQPEWTGGTIENVNVAGWDGDVTAPGGGTISFRDVQFRGPLGLRATNAGGFLEIGRVAFAGGNGLTIVGLVATLVMDGAVLTSAAVGAMFLTASAGALVFSITAEDCFINTADASQSGFDIDPGIVALSTPAIEIRGCQVSGPGSFLAAGSIGVGDPRMLSKGNKGIRDSLLLGDAQYTDTATPANVSGATNTWLVVPYESAAGLLALTDDNELFDLVDSLDSTPLVPGVTPPTRWAMRYIGGTRASPNLIWSALHQSGTGGTPFMEWRMSYDALGDGVWVGVQSTSRQVKRLGSYVQAHGEGAVNDIGMGALFRLELRTLDGALADSDIAQFNVKVSAEL